MGWFRFQDVTAWNKRAVSHDAYEIDEVRLSVFTQDEEAVPSRSGQQPASTSRLPSFARVLRVIGGWVTRKKSEASALRPLSVD
jgi:hypothetical protein